MFERRYQPALDGLRAIAALAVLFCHSRVPGFVGGAHGVDVFFVLSGYLITGLIRDEAQFSPLRFWWNRAVRLVPAMFLLLAAYLAIAPWIWPREPRFDQALLVATYTMNFALAYHWVPVAMGHTWSLAIEEQFYLFWPLILPAILCLKSPARWLLVLWAALTLFRVAVAWTHPWEEVYYPTWNHATGLILGSALALGRSPKVPLTLVAVILLSLLTFAHPETDFAKTTWATAAVEIATAGIIAGLQYPSAISRALAFEPLRRLGLISYGIYLWHWPIAWALRSFEWWTVLPLTLTASVGVATASYLLIENPIRRRFRISPLKGSSARPARQAAECVKARPC